MKNTKVETISVSDLRAHAEVLIELGLMPPLEKVLAVVAETGKKYGPKIEEARQCKSVKRRQA
jgi:hypothetical protein